MDIKNLTPQQDKALSIFKGIKSAYRRETFAREGLDYNALTAELLKLGHLKQSKAGALSLSKAALDILDNRLSLKDPTVAAIVAAVGYRGQRVTFSLNKAPSNLDSYWDGGSKSTYYFFNLDTQSIFELPTNHPAFEPDKPRSLAALPQRVLLIEHRIFAGTDLGLKIYSNEQDRARLIKD